MTDHETEALVRETFRSREHLVAGRQTRLLADLEPRRPRNRGLHVAAAALAAGAVVAAVTVAVTQPDRGGSVAALPGAGQPAAPDGWTWYSSLGMEIAVPADWRVNDIDCNQTNAPSVVRGRALVLDDCLTPEPATKRVAGISPVGYAALEGVAGSPVKLDGVAATLTETTLPDGRYAAQLAVSSREIFLVVRTTDPAEGAAILDTARLVDVDRLGCATERPDVSAPADPPAAMVPAESDTVRICSYGRGLDSRLQASGELAPTDAAALVAKVNAAPAGRNPDQPPDQCLDGEPVTPDAVLLFSQGGGAPTPVWITFSSCTDRGLDNGVRQAHTDAETVNLISAAVQSGFGYSGLD
ncbi:MAG: hypothetical protein L0Y54_11030 [Sporichthyaceae bacterium]|nr:hypothetical protein [Sporichthyaceae bacterium]